MAELKRENCLASWRRYVQAGVVPTEPQTIARLVQYFLHDPGRKPTTEQGYGFDKSSSEEGGADLRPSRLVKTSPDNMINQDVLRIVQTCLLFAQDLMALSHVCSTSNSTYKRFHVSIRRLTTQVIACITVGTPSKIVNATKTSIGRPSLVTNPADLSVF